MSLYAEPTTQKVVKPSQMRLVTWALGVLLLCYVGWATNRFMAVQTELGKVLATAPMRSNGKITTWGTVLHTPGPAALALRCRFDKNCAPWVNARSAEQYPLEWAGGGAALLLLAWMFAMGQMQTGLTRKNPGQGHWASREDPDIGELLERTNGIKRRFKLDRDNPRTLYLGHMVPYDKKTKTHRYDDVSAIMMPQSNRFENLLVLGSPGSGKTRGIFQHNLMIDAYRETTAVVLDLKFPQTDSSFFSFIGIFAALGRPVYTFTPFRSTSMRLPLLQGINNITDAQSLARAIIAPPEHSPESGEYFKDNERNALSAMVLAVSASPTPTMKELHRLANFNVAELEAWYRVQVDPDVRQAVKSIFDQREDGIASILNGIKNKLQIFANPNVARATSSEEGEDIDLHAMIEGGGLLYLGFEQDHMQDGTAAVLVPLIKRRLDQALLEVAGRSPKGKLIIPLTYYFDELANIPRLPYLMNNASSLRSRRAGLFLGVQNSEQGGLVYTDKYWNALATNNLGTKVEFLWGSEGESMKMLAEKLGQETYEEDSVSESKHPWFSTPWAAENRKGTSVKLVKRPLMSEEEIGRAPRMHAAVKAKGHNWALVVTPGIEEEWFEVRTLDGRHVTLKNQMYEMYRNIKHLDLVEIANQRLAFNAIEVQAGAAPKMSKDATEMFSDWLDHLSRRGVKARIQRNEKNKVKVMIQIESMPEELRSASVLNYLHAQQWLNFSENEREVTITQAGVGVLGKGRMMQLRGLATTGLARHWLRLHPNVVANLDPEIGVAEEGVQSEPRAYYTAESVSLPYSVVRELYNTIPEGLERVRKGKDDLIVIPLNDPARLEAAIDASKAKENAEKTPQTTAEQATAEQGGGEQQERHATPNLQLSQEPQAPRAPGLKLKPRSERPAESAPVSGAGEETSDSPLDTPTFRQAETPAPSELDAAMDALLGRPATPVTPGRHVPLGQETSHNWRAETWISEPGDEEERDREERRLRQAEGSLAVGEDPVRPGGVRPPISDDDFTEDGFGEDPLQAAADAMARERAQRNADLDTSARETQGKDRAPRGGKPEGKSDAASRTSKSRSSRKPEAGTAGGRGQDAKKKPGSPAGGQMVTPRQPPSVPHQLSMFDNMIDTGPGPETDSGEERDHDED